MKFINTNNCIVAFVPYLVFFLISSCSSHPGGVSQVGFSIYQPNGKTSNPYGAKKYVDFSNGQKTDKMMIEYTVTHPDAPNQQKQLADLPPWMRSYQNNQNIKSYNPTVPPHHKMTTKSLFSSILNPPKQTQQLYNNQNKHSKPAPQQQRPNYSNKHSIPSHPQPQSNYNQHISSNSHSHSQQQQKQQVLQSQHHRETIHSHSHNRQQPQIYYQSTRNQQPIVVNKWGGPKKLGIPSQSDYTHSPQSLYSIRNSIPVEQTREASVNLAEALDQSVPLVYY